MAARATLALFIHTSGATGRCWPLEAERGVQDRGSGQPLQSCSRHCHYNDSKNNTVNNKNRITTTKRKTTAIEIATSPAALNSVAG